MYKIVLINMPFANLGMPSIALTQLKAALDAQFKDRVAVDIVYLNHDFANSLGHSFYQILTNSVEAQNSGLGDWFFRQVAFPEEKNNAGIYLERYLPFRTQHINKLKKDILEARRGLDALMNRLISEYQLEQYNLAGFTSMFTQNISSLAMARKLKERNPEIITVMGGANCESPMGQVIIKNAKQIDYVFSGPGLKSFPRFIQHCLDQEMEKCNSIKGVFTKRNYFFQSGPEAIGEELSIDVPLELNYEPFIERLADKFPNGEVKPVLLFETSRGCWWGERAHCTFCGLNGMSMAYRAMSPELALKQFDSLFKLSEQVHLLESVDNILPKNYLTEVLPLVETPPHMSIFYEVKADLSESDVAVLAKARVTRIQPGIESLATSTLKLMKKGTSAFQNIMLLKYCLLYGINPAWNLLVGFPGEGEEVYQKYIRDLPLLMHLPPPSGVHPVRFDRYSPYFMRADEYELKLRPLDFYSLIYPFGEEDLSGLAYYFADTNVAAPYAQTMVKWIDKVREKVVPWIARWQRNKQLPAPKLFFTDNPCIVHDSRSGAVIEHRVGEVGRQILDLLNKPRHLSEVAKALSEFPGLDAAGELARLQESGLLFEEGGRYLSLVLRQCPEARGEPSPQPST